MDMEHSGLLIAQEYTGFKVLEDTPLRELDFDAIQTIDDIKAVLKVLRLSFSSEVAGSISHLLKKA